MTRFCLVVSVLGLIACGGDSTEPEGSDGFGSVEVTLARAAGAPSLMFSATIQVGDGPDVPLQDNETSTVNDVPAGTQTVVASSLTPNCTIEGQNPRTVEVAADQLTRVTLEVSCAFAGLPRLLFLRRVPPWDYDVWTIRADGTELAQLTSDGTYLTPTWSPDGTRIVVMKGVALWVMNYDGTESRFLIGNSGLASWSPDGSKIIFSRQATDPGPTNIWIINADGSNLQAITQTPGSAEEQMPALSPDEQKIAFCENSEVLVVIDANGSNPDSLTEATGCGYPQWSSDGTEIIFTGGNLPDGTPPQIYRINPDGTGLAQLTDIESGCASPSYSPDGDSILFNTHGGGDEEERAWIMDVNGDNPRYFEPIPWPRASFLRWWEG